MARLVVLVLATLLLARGGLSKDPEKRARQLANLRNAPPAPAGNNNNTQLGLRSKQPWTLPGSELSEQRVLEMIGTPEWIEQQDAMTVSLLVGSVQLIDHAFKKLASDAGMGFEKWRKAMLAIDRFQRTAGEQADKLALNPEARARLGLAVAKTKAVEVTPVRSVERARMVANLLDRFGVLPPGAIEPAVDAEVVDDAEPETTDVEPLPEAARRDLGLRHIFDRGL
jgi:hypothetical protein